MKTVNKSLSVVLAAIGSLVIAAPALGQQPMTMDELLRAVERGRVQDNKENMAREARFAQERAAQDRLLQEARAEKATEERRSERLEDTAEKNKEEIAKLEAQLPIRD
jgi:biopolymer transport protein ExbB